MAQKNSFFEWQNSIAITTAIVAVLAATASFRASSTSSSLLLEKNNANNYQSKANKEWNTYLANDITGRALKHPPDQFIQQTLKTKVEELERQADKATVKANAYFENNTHLTTAGTFFEIAIALLAMATLVKKKMVWLFSLALAAAGLYFLLSGVI
ncbi:DUF4337 family protein [Candidatus Roizmanbacteria bacterium]|nr:DUF4337 family protein [Candidatus Roizmanbacteria bacterium]